MKNALLLIFLLCCAVLPHLAQAQSIKASLEGDACPNKDYTYTYTGSALGCSWVVKGAYTLVSGGGANSNFITVNWKDVPTDATNNPTSVGLSCNTGGPPALPVFVSSISNQTPGPLTINGTQVSANYTLPFGDVTALTLRVPLVELPQSTLMLLYPIYALTYSWVIPSGWRYSDGVVSDGTNPRRVPTTSNAQGNQISVTPSPGGSGLISVRAINNNCLRATTGADNSVSQLQSFNLIRSTPQLSIISDKSPSGGSFALICGDQSDYHFRSIASAVPAGGSFDNYTFSFQGSGVITPTGSVAGATPASNFTGATGTAQVGMNARYTRNGASTTVSAPVVTVQVTSLSQPVITSSLGSSTASSYPTLCSSATATFSTSVAGANSYTWTTTGGLGINGPGITSLTTSSNTITIYPGGGNSGQGSVSVTAVNTTVSGCASPTATYNLSYGGPAAHDGSWLMHSDQFDYESNCPSGCAGICPGSRLRIQPRDQPRSAVQEAVWRVYRTDVSPAQLLTTQRFTGSAANNSLLDYTFRGSVVGNQYEVQLQESNACGLGPINSYNLQVIDCAGGYEPFRVGTSHATSQTTAYPNPTDDALTLEQGGGPVVLTDAQGRAVRSQKAQPGSVRLDTRSLPAGLYFLEMRDAAGKPVRQQIRVTH